MLEAKKISKVYAGRSQPVSVLKGIDLQIKKGEFSAIIGPSGAGKSTLLHILGGLDAPTEGNVFFQGNDVNALDEISRCRLRNEKIGFVFQFYHLLPEFTVWENVLMPALITGRIKIKSPNPKQKTGELLAKVGLEKRMQHFPDELSGGEKQRVAIARALINAPEILFCDEPTGNLDSATGNEIILSIKTLNQKEGMSVILVTHNIDLTKEADSVYHLKDGRLVN